MFAEHFLLFFGRRNILSIGLYTATPNHIDPLSIWHAFRWSDLISHQIKHENVEIAQDIYGSFDNHRRPSNETS